MNRALIIVFLFLSSTVNSQFSIDQIQLDLIPQPKVREFIANQSKSDINDLTDIKPSCFHGQNLSDFRHQVRNYIITDSLDKVWNTYLHTSPAKSWDGHKVKFGVLISKNTQEVLYPGEEINKIDTGQVVYLNLKIMKGIYNLPLAFEIIKIDPVRHIIELSYINGNVSQGVQQLHFFTNHKGNTVVVHSSYFKSHSKFRDMFLYPYFHERATDEFHHNMIDQVKKTKILALKK